MNRPAWQRRLILAGKIGLAGGLLVWLALSGRLQWGRLAAVSLDGRFVILLALVAGSMVLPAIRWWWLLRIQGLSESLWKVVSLTWAGYLASIVLPGAAGGDLSRGYLILRRHGQARARALSTVLADRFLGLHSLFCLGALSAAWLLASGGSNAALGPLVLLTLGPLAAMTLGLSALLCAPSRRLLFCVLPNTWRTAWDESFGLYRTGILGLLGCFGLSLASSTMTIASFAVAGRLLCDATPFADSFLAAPLVVVVNCVPITPGGIGLAEAASSELFSRLGSTGGAEIMILVRACGIVISLPGVLALAVLSPAKRNPKELAVADSSSSPRNLAAAPPVQHVCPHSEDLTTEGMAWEGMAWEGMA